jgi:AraC-like DNA-binding protein
MDANIVDYSPNQALQPFIAQFWTGSFNSANSGRQSMRIIPNGYVELIIHLTDQHCDLHDHYGWSQSPDYTIIGLHTHPYEVQFAREVKVFAIRFMPEGVYNIFGVPAAEFKEGYNDMSLVLGNEFRTFSEQLREKSSTNEMISFTEEYLIKTTLRSRKDINYVNRAAALIRSTKGKIRIEDLPELVHISLRQLQRAFKDKIGVSPKHYLRLSRINEVHRLLEEEHSLNLTQIAYQSGYTDQAHFIRDYKSITGHKPTIFIKERNQFIVNSVVAKSLL